MCRGDQENRPQDPNGRIRSKDGSQLTISYVKWTQRRNFDGSGQGFCSLLLSQDAKKMFGFLLNVGLVIWLYINNDRFR